MRRIRYWGHIIPELVPERWTDAEETALALFEKRCTLLAYYE